MADMGVGEIIMAGIAAAGTGYGAYETHKAASAKTPDLPDVPKPADTGDMAGQMLAAQKMAQSAGGTILSKDKGMFGSDTMSQRKSLLGL